MTNRIEDIGTRKLKNQIFLKVILLAETSDNKNVDVVCFFCREKFSNLKGQTTAVLVPPSVMFKIPRHAD